MAVTKKSLSKFSKDYVEVRLCEGGYGTASEYVRELIRNDQKSTAQEQLERLLLEGLESGDSVQIDDDFWKKKKADLTKRLQSQS